MGKTMALFLAIAMIATGIAMLPAQTRAGELFTVTGTVVDDVTSQPVGGAKVTISNGTISKNITTLSTGVFTIYIEPGNYTVLFEKVGYRDGNTTIAWAGFNQTSKKAEIGTHSIVPLPTVTGKVLELGTTNTVSDVEVTITYGATVEQVKTVDGVFSSPVDSTLVDINFKKNGYYDNEMEGVTVGTYGVTNLGNIYIEKIVPTPTIKVWGYVFEDGTTSRLADAIVSISAGDEKWITSVSDEYGYFEMLAYPGNFEIRGSLDGYSNSVPVWFTVTSDMAVRHDIYLEKIPAETLVLDGTVTGDGVALVGEADVYLHSNDGKYVNHVQTVGGDYTLNFYPGATFTLEVRKEGFFTYVHGTGITANATVNVDLDKIVPAHTLSGVVSEKKTNTPLEGATVTIYCTNRIYSNTTETLANGYFEFMVHDNSSFMIVADADGFQAEAKAVNSILADKYVEFDLYPSGTDVTETTYTFTSWNTIEVNEMQVLSVDNVSVKVNADRKYDMGPVGLSLNDWTIDAANDVPAWEAYLVNKGVERKDTRQFLTVNNTYYMLNETLDVTVEGADGVSVTAHTTIFINSTYTYTLTGSVSDPGALADADSYIYKLGFNATYDTVYMDNIDKIILPLSPVKYEMVSNVTETNNVEVTGYNDPITIDPMVYGGDMDVVTMTIEMSDNGTADAKVVSGNHYVLNSTYDNYSVIVSLSPVSDVDTNVTFSAESSTDKVGDIERANFTWDMGDGTTKYGMTVKYDYTLATADGERVVRLVITETGGNKTYHNITVFVDSQNPEARISAVVTDSENVTFNAATSTLTVNEDRPIVFSGVKFSDAEGMGSETIVGWASTDEITGGDGGKGIIEKWYWSWGEDNVPDETITKSGSNNITHIYNTPGTYTLNMITTDVVSRESTNATWTVIVKDKTAPVGNYVIKNSAGTVVTEVIENGTFTYNASSTTDNFDKLANLTFDWFFDINGNVVNYTGQSISYTFTQAGDFNVTLKATDKAGNYLNKTEKIHVNLQERPNILMKVGSMVFSKNPGKAGDAMTISVNITNDGKANATDITTKFYIRNSDGTDDEIGTATTAFLGIGNTTTVSISWTPGKKGDYSIWANSTCAGEHSSQWWDNKINDFSVQKVTVDEAAWVLPVIIIAIVVVIIVVFVGMRYFMKSGTEADESGEKRKKR